MTSKQHKKLQEHSKHQEKILVCYRPNTKTWWGDRCFYNEEGYDKNKEYNHRSILDNEIIIEYDDDNPEVNKQLTDKVCERLRSDDVAYSKYWSGNKSQHVHIMVDINGTMNLSLLKNAFIRHYTQGRKWGGNVEDILPLPDMGLCGNRMIRMEGGIHEKTQKHKEHLYTTPGYGTLVKLKQEVWDRYDAMYERVQKWKSTNISKEVANSKQVKMLLDTVRFNKYGDGRERALYILIHMLKDKYKEEYKDNEYQGRKALSEFLTQWYRSSKGHKLTNVDIERKVGYHYNRSYNLNISYINTFLEEIGVEPSLLDY